MDEKDWEQRVELLWASIDEVDDFLPQMAKLVVERPPNDAIAMFEQASAYDSMGEEARAVERYRAALQAGLDGQRKRRATIQLASSLRNLGQAEESVALLEAELKQPSDDLDDAVRAFLALALTSAGREREAVGMALTALAPHLVRYNRSLTNYAEELRAAT